MPSVILASIFPMHALWFRACVKGFIRRNRAGREAAQVALNVAIGTEDESR